jgi:hypothetical protein
MSDEQHPSTREIGLHALRALGAAAVVFSLVLFLGLVLWHPEGGNGAGARHLGFLLALAMLVSACVLLVAASPLAMQQRPGRQR